MTNYSISNKTYLFNTLKNFIKLTKFNSRYISLQLQFVTKDNDIIDLGNIFYVDISNDKSIKSCLAYYYRCYNSESYFIDNQLEINLILLNYQDINRSEYIQNFYKK